MSFSYIAVTGSAAVIVKENCNFRVKSLLESSQSLLCVLGDFHEIHRKVVLLNLILVGP